MESAKRADWDRKVKTVLAGVAMTGASLVMPRPVQAFSESLINGGFVTAGAAATSLVVRASRNAKVPPPPTAAATAAPAISTLLEPIPVPVVHVQAPAPVVTKLTSKQLASMLAKEIPAWHRGLLVAAPMAALVTLVGAAKKWAQIEGLAQSQLRIDGQGEETSVLAVQLAALEAKLATATKTSAGFEGQLKTAHADLETVQTSLVVSQKEAAEAGKALWAAIAATELQESKLGETQSSAKAESQRRAEAARADLDAQLSETEELRRQLGLAQQEALEATIAMTEADNSRETAETEAGKVRMALEKELHAAKERVVSAKKAEAAAVDALQAQEEWRKSRDDWEAETKSSFLSLEQELKDTVAKLAEAEKAAENASEGAAGIEEVRLALEEELKGARLALEEEVKGVTVRAEAAEEQMEVAATAAAAARASFEDTAATQTAAREAAEKSLMMARAEMATVREAMEVESSDARAAEQALEDAMVDAQRLRAEMEALRKVQSATAAALEDARTAMEASMLENAESALDKEKIRELKATHDAQMWEMECNIRALEETMVKAHSMARQNAERMLRHNEQMGRVIQGKMKGDADIPVKFEIVVATDPGQRVAMVGTWNDWKVEDAFPMRWTEKNVWTVTTPIHADDTYEYKYVIIDDTAANPLANAVWQYGNNRVLALQLSLHNEVVLVEVMDSWIPNPKAMPIMLHQLDGTVEEVGSTQLLRDCVRDLRTEQALLDGSEMVRVLQEISTMTLGGSGGELPALIAAGRPASDGPEAAARAEAQARAQAQAQARGLPDAASPLQGDVTLMAKVDGTTTVMPAPGPLPTVGAVPRASSR